jgi:hypothetical protein
MERKSLKEYAGEHDVLRRHLGVIGEMTSSHLAEGSRITDEDFKQYLLAKSLINEGYADYFRNVEGDYQTAGKVQRKAAHAYRTRMFMEADEIVRGRVK